MIKRLLPLIIFVVLIGFLYVGLGLNPKKLPSPLINKPFPDIGLTDFKNNEPIFSRQTLLGKVSLVNIWASWCVTCRAEHQVLNSLARQNNLNLVGINYKDKKKDAVLFLKNLGNPFKQIMFDPKGKLGLELGVYATPESFIVDRLGVIRYKHIGELTQRIIDNEINPVLERL